MNTLVLRQVPDGLYRRLKAVAAAHRRSMNQQAILCVSRTPAGSVAVCGQRFHPHRPEAGAVKYICPSWSQGMPCLRSLKAKQAG